MEKMQREKVTEQSDNGKAHQFSKGWMKKTMSFRSILFSKERALKIERIWILSAGIGVKIELFNIVLETCEDYMENSVKNSEQFALFSFSE